MLTDDAIVVNIQGDEPLLRAEIIDSLVQNLQENGDVPMATLAYPDTNKNDLTDPGVVKVVLDAKGRALYFSRSPIPRARDADTVKAYKICLPKKGCSKFLECTTKIAYGEMPK